MSRWMVMGLDATQGNIRLQPLPPPGGVIRLRALPGARAIHIPLSIDGETRRRFEVEVTDGDLVRLEVLSLEPLDLKSPGRHLLRLPGKMEDPRIQVTAAEEQTLNLALVLDGTRLWASPSEDDGAPELAPVLGLGDRWSTEIQCLADLVERLAQKSKGAARVTALSWGDRPPPFTVARDLRPSYVVFPDRVERFEDFQRARLIRSLEALLPSSGGDAVDAVGDALAACARLPWDDASRQLVVLVGDSPGYSILHPAPQGAAAMTRAHDVDVAATDLFDLGVEIATLFAPPPQDFVRVQAHAQILEHTRRQYRRLASLPDWSHEVEDLAELDTETLAASLSRRYPLRGHNASLGLWAEEPTGPLLDDHDREDSTP